MVEFYVAAGLVDRIIFGSDFPFNHCHDQKSVVQGILALNFPSEIRERIFCRNLEALIGMQP